MGNFQQNLNNQRERFIKVFNDTESFIKENKILSEAVEHTKSNTSIHKKLPEKYPEVVRFPNNRYTYENVYVTDNKTFQAAFQQVERYPNKKVAVLNFASATTPGGGVKTGASAQEECLCRASTLYDCLNTKRIWNEFYNPNRATQNPLHDDKIVYTPDVIICKTDDGNYTRLPEKEFIKVDVITCAAPNLREQPTNKYNTCDGQAVKITEDELYKIHLERAKHIIYVAYSMGAQVLILGAFGCGAFKNDPWVVARAYRDALKDLGKLFTEIEFAIYCRGYETENYDAFYDMLIGD